ncbi:MAG: (2Fe-2S)-binding protein, partial [Planctomycetes bacterium]|nr:(2Fe-2S)-binding protein [Planctomycetota bacterium]
MSRDSFRTDAQSCIDRRRALHITFDGKSYVGRAGDTLASALLANGVHLVGRSFKYHRPRGIMTAGPEEPNALIELRSGARREPNLKATTVELYDGLEAYSQNRWPSLAFDLLSVNGLLSPFLHAGFYYKTFMWPRTFWKAFYEPLIRRSAGLGRAAEVPDPDHYEKAFAHCDVLVIGCGLAGLMAARTAGRAGARVILAEMDFELGGRLLSEKLSIEGQPGAEWRRTVLAELEGLDNVRIMRRTTVFGVYDAGTYGAIEQVNDHAVAPPAYEPRQRSWRITAKRAVLAAGALERSIAFPGNDRPGVMLGSAVRTYINRFGVRPGSRAVLFATGEDGWTTARELAAAGVTVEAVVTPHGDRRNAERAQPWRVFSDSVIESTRGWHRLRSVTIRDGHGKRTSVNCDLLAVSNGWNPTLHLTCHLGGKPQWDETLSAFVPGGVPRGMSVAGSAAGHFGLAEALADGARLGAEAARETGFDARPSVPSTDATPPPPAEPLWQVPDAQGPAFVDVQNDVTIEDIALAHREGFGASEHVKRYTTLGMGTDQGKTANVVALGVIANITGRTIPDIGTTGFRPPYAPITWGAMVGHHRG